MSITTKVINYDSAFKGIIEVKGKNYKLDNVLKDEVVDIDISKDGKNVILKQIKTASSKRVKPVCPIYNKCGGCSLLHIDYREQLKMKKELGGVRPLLHEVR